MEKQKRIIVKDVCKRFRIGFRKRASFLERIILFFSGRESKKVIKVLDKINLEVYSGEIVGLVGENGCGKSTLLRIIAGIIRQDSGEIITNGRVVSLINLNVGLKDRLTMKDNIFLIGSLFGMSYKEILRRYNSITSFSELKGYENTKIYQFSNGMRQRLVFSVAVACSPDVLLLDEVFEVGDENFKKKSSHKIKEIIKKGGCVILVSHDMDLIRRNCGRVVELGSKLINIKS
jgi:ABC-type polysaccharide/polyol phosphate transport system ATPase subunit